MSAPAPERARRRSTSPPAASTLVRIKLDDLAFGGEAIGKVDGRVVFVPYGLPGEEVLIELTEERRDYARGRIVEIITASPRRVAAPCPYFGECGGCSLQHADYSAQLEFKRHVVAQQLERIGQFEAADALVRPTIGMVWPWEYRNHARFTVGRRMGELCFTRRGTRSPMRIERCSIMQPAINGVMGRLQDQLVGLKAHQVAIRIGANTGDLLINPDVTKRVPELASGQDALEEEILGRRFRIASPAFFQVNTRRELRPAPDGLRPGPWPLPNDGLSMAEIMALVVHDRLELLGHELLVDAFCGVGTFAILLASAARRVIGIEESTAAIKDARHNARDLANVEFLEGKIEQLLPNLPDRPDAVVLDPARVGCQPAVLQALADLEVPRVVYVSCDPATLARDLRTLVDLGFNLDNVQPLDMFPQTYHVEAVALLTE